MDEEPDRKPLFSGRGVLGFEEFRRATGLDRATVEGLMRTELSEVSLWRDEELTRPFGIFDDALPSRQELAAPGLSVRDDYAPETLRSSDGVGDDDPDKDARPAYRLTW